MVQKGKQKMKITQDLDKDSTTYCKITVKMSKDEKRMMFNLIGRHIEEIKAITEQIKRCESKHYYTQALPLRKRLKLLKTQLRVYDKEMGYQR
jgi:F0F1-type ATP synthase beta subunit